MALPAGEHNYFERKAGKVFEDPHFQASLAKALSALANSGGGHLLLGVKNDGTFDGVPALTKKGKTSTRDWLEQLASNLLDYALQDFRVHQVEPTNPSAIPEGKIVIIIDVGDSMLAPHQSVEDSIYYLRAGGRSRPAPHHYLERLRDRQNFPGGKVARAWLDSVIRPLLRLLEAEKEFLEAGKWDWNYIGSDDPYGEQFKALHLLNRPPYYTENHEQFLEYYPSLSELLGRHDTGVGVVDSAVTYLLSSVGMSETLRRVVEEALQPEALERLRGEGDIPHNATPEEISRRLRGSMNDDEVFKLLSQMIVAQLTFTGSYNIGPLWKANRETFLTVLKDPAVAELSRIASDARWPLLETVELLTTELKEIKRQLATRYREPYEVPAPYRGGR